MADRIKHFIEKVGTKYELSLLEKTALEAYVFHVHPESKISFLKDVLKKGKEYLNTFLDQELEEFGEEKFESETNEGEKKQNHKDLYDALKEKDATKVLLIYNATVQRISALETSDREKVYSYLRFTLDKTKPKLERRKEFFSAFRSFIESLPDEKFHTYVDVMFDASRWKDKDVDEIFKNFIVEKEQSKEQNMSNLLVADLKKLAKEKGIKNYSKMRKADLIKALHLSPKATKKPKTPPKQKTSPKQKSPDKPIKRKKKTAVGKSARVSEISDEPLPKSEIPKVTYTITAEQLVRVIEEVEFPGYFGSGFRQMDPDELFNKLRKYAK
jgi:hypothetical protein